MKAIKTIARLMLGATFAIVSAAGCITLADAVLGDVISGLVIAPMFSLIVGCSIYQTIGGDLK